MKMKQKTCVVCGETFWVECKQGTAKKNTCSEKCWNERRKQRELKSFYKNHDANLVKMRIWHRKRSGKEITPDVYDISVKRKCEWCGKEYSVSHRGTWNAKYCSASCKNDKLYYGSLENKRNAMLRRLIAAIEREKKIKEKEQHRIDWERHCAEEYAKEKVCIWCGAVYHSESDTSKFCSGKCREKAKRKADPRINETNCVDKDITLQKLYHRDNGTCYICGGTCDWGDWNEEKNHPGNAYPTIEHVIPLARGGLHSWENVRLAHWKCNVQKGTNVPKRYKPAARVPKRTQNKMTAQFTKDGGLLAVYYSTAEAAELTGFNKKHIQDAARGERKIYHGYIWKYVS